MKKIKKHDIDIQKSYIKLFNYYESYKGRLENYFDKNSDWNNQLIDYLMKSDKVKVEYLRFLPPLKLKRKLIKYKINLSEYRKVMHITESLEKILQVSYEEPKIMSFIEFDMLKVINKSENTLTWFNNNSFKGTFYPNDGVSELLILVAKKHIDLKRIKTKKYNLEDSRKVI